MLSVRENTDVFGELIDNDVIEVFEQSNDYEGNLVIEEIKETEEVFEESEDLEDVDYIQCDRLTEKLQRNHRLVMRQNISSLPGIWVSSQ